MQVLLLLGGFLLPRSDIKPWWIWFYWANPLSYIQQSIAINEYLSPRWYAITSQELWSLLLSLWI